MGSEELGVSIDGHIATLEIRRPPNNFLDIELIGELATALEALDEDKNVRAIVLAHAFEELAHAPDVRRDARHARGEALEHDERLRLADRGEHVEPDLREDVVDLLEAEQLHGPFEAEVLHEVAALLGVALVLVVGADHPSLDVGHLVRHDA